MRLESVELSWFRGAAESSVLDIGSKSVVVYGVNGSGKSSFVDAVEYAITDKVRHLSMEYSGPKQLNAILNTQKPAESPCKVSIVMSDSANVCVTITPGGLFQTSSEPSEAIHQLKQWKLQTVVLRQHEIADFINETKGGKYSSLIPILGMERYSQAVETIRGLRRSISDQSGLEGIRKEIDGIKKELLGKFGSISESTIESKIRAIAASLLGASPEGSVESVSKEVVAEVSRQIEAITPTIMRLTVFKDVLSLNTNEKLDIVIENEKKIVRDLDPLLNKRITVLEATKKYVSDPKSGEQMICPSCGRDIEMGDLVSYVSDELDRNIAAKECLARTKVARKGLYGAIKDIIEKMNGTHIRSWLDMGGNEEVRAAIDAMATMRVPVEDEVLDAEDVVNLRKWLPIIHSALENGIAKESVDASFLVNARDTALVALKLPTFKRLENKTLQITAILDTLDKSEELMNAEVRSMVNTIFQAISSQVQQYWSIIHPNEPIESIRLYCPEDKSIDIELKFYGKVQQTPRLTLSEGHRNSLGLCVFLALARLEGEDNPLIMDDIVSSLDKEHRAALVDVFQNHFSDRQLILLTHDLEWFKELRERLPAGQYKFMKLKPWRSPAEGVYLAESRSDFSEARDLIEHDTNSAANKVRAIMDHKLGVACESLNLQMVYRAGDHNDHRGYYEFMTTILGGAKNSLIVADVSGKEDKACREQIVVDWQEALKLLKLWGNRGSHTGHLSQEESNKLIDACQKAWNDFTCGSCHKPIWALSDSREKVPKEFRCTCGRLAWVPKNGGL